MLRGKLKWDDPMRVRVPMQGTGTVRREEEEVFHGRIASQYPVLRKLLDRFRDSKIKVEVRTPFLGSSFLLMEEACPPSLLGKWLESFPKAALNKI
jgi:hypothetical protein